MHITKHHPDAPASLDTSILEDGPKVKKGGRKAPSPFGGSTESLTKINPVLSRQTEFDCHQCGLACHSWANLEKHLQWHEEADSGGSNADPDS